MNKIKFEFDFTYFTDESVNEENAENAKYIMQINNINLRNHEVEDILLYINKILIEQMGHCIIKNKYKNQEYIVNVQTDQVEAEKIPDLVSKIQNQFKILFTFGKVDKLSQIGNDDLAYNTRKLKF